MLPFLVGKGGSSANSHSTVTTSTTFTPVITLGSNTLDPAAPSAELDKALMGLLATPVVHVPVTTERPPEPEAPPTPDPIDKRLALVALGLLVLRRK